MDRRLAEWTDAGLISAAQAERIAAHERTRRHDGLPAHDAGSDGSAGSNRRTALAEAVGYVGAALALAAVGLFVGELWPELRLGGQLVLVALLTLLAAGAGRAVHPQPAPALQRLTAVLWAAAAIGAAWFVGLVAHEVLEFGPETTSAMVGGAGAAVALVLLRLRPSLPLQAVGLAGVVTVALATLSMAALRPDAFWYGLLAAAIGGAWLLLGHGGWLRPERTAEVLGGLVALLASQGASFGQLRESGLALGLAIAVSLVALAVAGDAGHHLVLGAIGLFVLVPQLVLELFGDTIGAPATLLVVGLLLVLLAVGLGRVRREVTGSDQRQQQYTGAGR